MNPLSVAIGAEASFVARSLDIDVHHLLQTLDRASKHKGTSFVEVYQNCNVFNDGAFMEFADKAVRPDRTVTLEHGKPLDLREGPQQGHPPERRDAGGGGAGERGQGERPAGARRDAADPAIAYILARMQHPEYPVPMGVLRAVERPTYDDLMTQQITDAVAKEGEGDLATLLAEGGSWVVE